MDESANALLVVSNRGPVHFEWDAAAGTLHAKRAAGGLVNTLGPGAHLHAARWLAASTSEDDMRPEAARLLANDRIGFWPVSVEPETYRAYYDIVSNQTLWFCLHGLWDSPRRPRFDRRWWQAWESYIRVNEVFVDEVDKAAPPGATVLIQDYQLALTPARVAKRRPDLSICSFVHTPWCSPDELSALPDEVAAAVLEGLAGGGPVGFHSKRWSDAFQACVETVLERPADTFVAAAAVDADELARVAASDECESERRKLRAAVGDRQLIVRVDRLELSKNVLRGFWAYEELLEVRPDLRGKVVFAALVYPSRVGLAEYQAYGQEVLSLASRINDRWGTSEWTPILVHPEDNYPRSVAALRSYDVLLVNPLRDGLNLVSMEGPSTNERDGVLVLSRQAGSAVELGDAAISVNPFDVSATANALARALDLPAEQRRLNAERLREAASRRTPQAWFDDLVAAARSRHGRHSPSSV
jgi:trehalose 6-phosphate synthase